MPLPKLLKQQKFLFVGPHPDDIEVACGSTVAKLVKMGK
ncbi:MAG: PIG-L family deacetylase, partial [Clostridia bacterium]|nr:PIG-L family deacetylase [Clostridia bacterium]